MAQNPQHTIYNRSHNLQIFNRNGFYENRCVNITVTDLGEHIQVKVRDSSDFVFNYTSNIDYRSFEFMKLEQKLDIDYSEFKSNLLEMLQQIEKQEMFLKCEIDASKCFLVFYNKSRIKSLVFLVLDLQMTNQKEIFDEMNSSIQEFQSLSKSLQSQVQMMKKQVQDRDSEIKQITYNNHQVQNKFVQDLQQISAFFSNKLQETSAQLVGKILKLSQQILKLVQDIEIVKVGNSLRSESSSRLLQNLENLRQDNLENTKIINELKRENCNLKNSQLANEQLLNELNANLSEKHKHLCELQDLKNELEKDVKQATVIIAQKSATNDELAKDVVQANQMLVNFNHLFATKSAEIEDLKKALQAKDKIIHEQTVRFQDLRTDFEEYRTKFNLDRENKLAHELFAANKRVEEVEKLNRETVKLNELLTRKLASGDFGHRNFR